MQVISSLNQKKSHPLYSNSSVPDRSAALGALGGLHELLVALTLNIIFLLVLIVAGGRRRLLALPLALILRLERSQ